MLFLIFIRIIIVFNLLIPFLSDLMRNDDDDYNWYEKLGEKNLNFRVYYRSKGLDVKCFHFGKYLIIIILVPL